MPSTRALQLLSWIVVGIATSLAIGSILLEALGPADLTGTADPEAGGGGTLLVAVEAAVASSFTVLGALVVSRQPRNPIGWLLEVMGLAFSIIGIAGGLYLRVVLPDAPGAGVATYVVSMSTWAWLPAFVPAFTFLPLLFPTGRPLSSRWRPVVWVAAVSASVGVLTSALKPGQLDGAPAVDNPFGIDHPARDLADSVAFGVLFPVALISLGSMVVRFRRSVGVERQQLKWVVAASASLPVAFAAAAFVGDFAWPLMLIALLVVAGAVAVAMLRYRLYDIDLVINRALVYAVLTATLGSAYVGGVLLLQLARSADSSLAVAGSTLAVAALFRPARAKIQNLVDRRFYRRKYDAARTLADFGGRLREQVDLTALSSDLQTVVRETVQPAHVSLWLRS